MTIPKNLDELNVWFVKEQYFTRVEDIIKPEEFDSGRLVAEKPEFFTIVKKNSMGTMGAYAIGVRCWVGIVGTATFTLLDFPGRYKLRYKVWDSHFNNYVETDDFNVFLAVSKASTFFSRYVFVVSADEAIQPTAQTGLQGPGWFDPKLPKRIDII
jgi:hypothetical protein